MGARDVLIRRARAEDAGGLLRYIGDLYCEKLDVVSNELTMTQQQEEEWIAATNKSGAVLVAERNGAIVGMLDIRRSDRRSRAHVGSIGMSVAKLFRRQGIGRHLLEAAIQEAKSWPDFCRLELEVVPWNAPAIALYEDFGFKLEARKAKAVNFRGAPEDMLLMALTW
ncbi:MAG TPA: N-acetyltransferase [Alphaproteobacteria bacterium]|nr:N-acetyltransferase [Alphaproteobacteria bacterium]